MEEWGDLWLKIEKKEQNNDAPNSPIKWAHQPEKKGEKEWGNRLIKISVAKVEVVLPSPKNVLPIKCGRGHKNTGGTGGGGRTFCP